MQEEDFRTRLDAELDDEPGPPIGSLVAAATQDGVRRRRRRSIVQLTAGTAGVAAIVAGASFAAGSFGRDSAATSAAGSGSAGSVGSVGAVGAAVAPAVAPTTPPSTPSTPATSTPGPVSSTSGKLPTEYDSSAISGLPTVPPGQARTTAEAMALLLEQNVTKAGGAGDFTHVTAYAPNGDPHQTQKTMFMSDLYWNHATIAVRYTLPPEHHDPNSAVKPGGDVFRWDTPGITGTSEVKLAKSQRGVELTRADGSKVMVLEINGRELGDAGPDRADLPFTSDQLLAIARDAHWGATMSADFVAQADATIQLDPHQ